jgi:hypothetical protein
MRHDEAALFDLLRCPSRRLDDDMLRLAQIAMRDAADLVGHRRREQRRLPLLGRVREDPLHILDEAHAEHLVRFVQDDGLDVAELERAPLDQVHDPPGRADDDVHTTAQLLQLAEDRSAAVDRDRPDARPLGCIAGHGLADLHGEFARRRQDERLRLGAFDTQLLQEGSAKAAVLPVPVCACPTRSRVCSSTGMARAWISVGSV